MIDIEAAFVEHFSYVYLYIRKLSHNEAIAEEITSETFFKALSAIDSFREDCDIRVWLCQIAKNCYFTHVKKLQREQPLESSDTDVPDSLLSGPMEAVLSKETVTEIQRSLHGLDEPYKEVFMFRRDELERFRPSPNLRANAGKYPHSHPYPLRFSG